MSDIDVEEKTYDFIMDVNLYMTGQTYHLDGGCLAEGMPWEYDTEF